MVGRSYDKSTHQGPFSTAPLNGTSILNYSNRTPKHIKMARGKFNKRGGGARVDAQSADEIEERNQRLAEFEETRAKRRAEAEEEEAGGDGEDDTADEAKKDAKEGGGDKKKDDASPVKVTSAEDHKKNLAKLEAVKARRAAAEAKRKIEEEAQLAAEMEAKAKFKQHEDEENSEDGKKKKKKSSKSKDIPKLTKIEIKKMKPAQMKDGKCYAILTADSPKRSNIEYSFSMYSSSRALDTYNMILRICHLSFERKRLGIPRQQERTRCTTYRVRSKPLNHTLILYLVIVYRRCLVISVLVFDQSLLFDYNTIAPTLFHCFASDNGDKRSRYNFMDQ